MIIIAQYDKLFNTDTHIFIKSKEVSCCPICNGGLKVRDTKLRHVINNDGSADWYKLRRLKCKDCGKIHTELPDFMIPYKHYEAAVIESVLDETRNDCLADNSTISRWKAAFRAAHTNINGLLVSFWMSVHQNTYPLIDPSSLLETAYRNITGWLALVHQHLINSGHTLHTRFAFCP